MIRIVLKLNKSPILQDICRPSDTLPGQPHVSSDLSHGQWRFIYSAQHLPEGAGQSQLFCQSIAGGKQAPIEMKCFQDELCKGFCGWCP